MELRCMICNDDKIYKCYNSLSHHIGSKHKDTTKKEYYDTYLKQNEEEGKCLTCGGDTNFIGITVGYYRFCCDSCVGNNKEIQEKKKATTRSHFGVDWPTQSEEVQQKIVETLQTEYGCSNSYNIPHIKEKAQKNSHTKEANAKRGVSISETRSELFKDPVYKESVISKTIANNIEVYGVEWPSQTPEIREKISATVKSSECQERAAQTCLRKYKVRHYTQSREYVEKARKRYIYNEISFDSSWELAVYIYCIDNNISINRSPCTLTYYIDDTKHYYTPDFIINGFLVEIKGNQFFDSEGNLLENPYNKSSIRPEYTACLKDNNVKLLRYEDIKICIDYCIKKYNEENPWYTKFRNI